MKILFPLLFAFSLPLSATQPYFGPEITSDLYAPVSQAQCAAAALVPLNATTTFLAWPMLIDGKPAIASTLLDANFHSILSTSATAPRTAEPLCVVATTDGRDIFVASSDRTVAGVLTTTIARYAKDGRILEPPQQLTTSLDTPRIGIASYAGFVDLVAGYVRFELPPGTALARAEAYRIPIEPYDSIAAGNASMAVVTVNNAPSYLSPWSGTTIPSSTLVRVLHPHWQYGPTYLMSAQNAATTSTAVACLGDACLVSAAINTDIHARWSEQGAASGPDYFVAALRTRDTVLASAADSQRVLTVWDDAGTIKGAFATRNAFEAEFVIADGGNARQRPAVVTLGAGRFLVAYEIVEGSMRRLGGRVIDIDPPARKRAVR